MMQESGQGDRKMVRCEITGQRVPEDEIIEIQGHRVCAAGKEELLERLRSGERLPGEMERPTFLRRFGCVFVDGLLLGLVGYLIGSALVPDRVITTPADLEKLRSDLAVSSALGLLINLTYLTLMHGSIGQTLGKMAGRIKVVTPDGKSIGMIKAFVRALVLDGPQLLTPFVMLAGSQGLLGHWNFAVLLYVLVNLVVMLSDRDQHRTIHDRVAGTRVILVD